MGHSWFKKYLSDKTLANMTPNYVDKIYDYLPTLSWTFFTLNVDKNMHFLTTQPPHLVHVFFERPLSESFWQKDSLVTETFFKLYLQTNNLDGKVFFCISLYLPTQILVASTGPICTGRSFLFLYQISRPRLHNNRFLVTYLE